MRYCLQFFADNFRNVTEYPVYKLEDGQYVVSRVVKIKNQLEKFNMNYIEKKINRFKNSHGTRFEPITMTTEDGDEIPLHMSGSFMSLKPGSEYASTILNRPMTWTDLFYQAAVNTLSDKYVYTTRYPIEGYNSIFPAQCFPLSTIDTAPAKIEVFGGENDYPYYPIIDLSLPKDKISNMFNDTVTMSDLCLDVMGADFKIHRNRYGSNTIKNNFVNA